MMVLVLEAVKPALRGEITRWLLEPHPGVFVGRVSALVRERLWEKCCKACASGGVILIHAAQNEQGYAVRLYGNTRRDVVDMEGLQLIMKRA